MNLIILVLAYISIYSNADFVAVDALIARVGKEAVLESDLERYQDLNKILVCIEVKKNNDTVGLSRTDLLNKYIDDEILYLEARSKKSKQLGIINSAVKEIYKKEACKKQWLDLGKKYSSYWNIDSRRKEGEGQLIKELEKRVFIQNYLTSLSEGDASASLQEAKIKTLVKVYLEK
ncbi:MAG: hypothetical protein M9962_13295 [Oligoflexia bacterium]|nr:hypothetical protein [Oligoflexia bacterium]